jgi:hypothetical protein
MAKVEFATLHKFPVNRDFVHDPAELIDLPDVDRQHSAHVQTELQRALEIGTIPQRIAPAALPGSAHSASCRTLP